MPRPRSTYWSRSKTRSSRPTSWGCGTSAPRFCTKPRLLREEVPPGGRLCHPTGREHQMERLFERVAGLDIHRDSIVACVRVPDEGGGRRQERRSFATTTQALLTLLDWLRSYGVTLVGMESTGVYWRPVYYLLEDHMECWLL